MSSDFVYNSAHSKVIGGGYMVGSTLFKNSIDTEHILNHNKNLAVPIGLLNFGGGPVSGLGGLGGLGGMSGGSGGRDGGQSNQLELGVETEESGLSSGMVGGSAFDSMLNQLDPSYHKTGRKSGRKSGTKKVPHTTGTGTGTGTGSSHRRTKKATNR